ncbi:hypothetical protein [Microbispora bryophytorum]|uniref:hypothetical protein n=1 Tax=Microbispora bryophytorum TaxID=1460882 RepID=UPI0033CDD91F
MVATVRTILHGRAWTHAEGPVTLLDPAEALDLFQVLMATRLLNTAKRKTEKERLSMLPQLEKASRTLARAAKGAGRGAGRGRGAATAAPAPCRARAATRSHADVANPPASEAITKTVTPSTRSRRRPVIEPPAGS